MANSLHDQLRDIVKIAKPKLIAWIILAVIGLYAYIAYVNEVQADKERAATIRLFERQDQLLRELGRSSLGLPLSTDGLAEMLADDKFEEDEYESVGGENPLVGICLGDECAATSRRIYFQLAYSLHFDYRGGHDCWEMVFAPIDDGHLTADPTRLVFRIVDDGGGGYGYLVANRRASADLGTDPHGEVATLVDFWESDAGEAAAGFAARETRDAANLIDAPLRFQRAPSELINDTRRDRLPLGSEMRELVESRPASAFVDSAYIALLPLLPSVALALAGLLAATVLAVLALFREDDTDD